MSEESQTIEDRIKGLEEETAVLVERLFALGADIAREGHWDRLPAALSAAERIEAARRALSNRRQGGKADPGTGPIDPPPVDGGGDVVTLNFFRGRDTKPGWS